MENKHLKFDLPQLQHINVSDHEENALSFQKRWESLFVKGMDGVNLQQSLF